MIPSVPSCEIKLAQYLYGGMSCTPDPHYVSRRHPNGGAYHIFDEAKMSALIREWQQTGNENLFRDIIEGSLDLIQTTIRRHHFYDYDELDAPTNDCILKLRQALPKYCAARGRAFTFISITLHHFLSKSSKGSQGD
jgi:hypothetical protein